MKFERKIYEENWGRTKGREWGRFNQNSTLKQ